MSNRKKLAITFGLVAVVALGAVMVVPQVEFVLGGALVNLGYRLQDRLGKYDLEHDESIKPDEIWDELIAHNDLAADVRDRFPRTVRHPVVAILACMDARIDTSELVGDTRRYYYIVRTAGSVLAPAEQEMLELAVINGVKVLVLTSHSDCAAEAAASNPDAREKFPALTELMDERVRRVEEFLARPVISEAIESGELQVKLARIDTNTDRLVVGDITTTFPAPSVSEDAHVGH